MSAKVARMARHMTLARASIIVFVVVAVLTTFFMIRMTQGEATPGSPTDSTQVPHYFGPWPNWALSPQTLADAQITINGDGSGATATASVGADGSISSITVTNPGAGYTQGATTVSIGGGGSGATADAVVQGSGGVSSIKVDNGGANYTKPTVTISGGGATTDATATPYGHLDTLQVVNAGAGYTAPTVDFDMPDDPNGTQAAGHVTWDQTTGAITGISIDNPGSGYASAPNVVIRDGTLMDPVNGGAGATAVATIAIDTIGLDTFGAGYTSAPNVTIAEGAANGAGAGASATAAVDVGLISAVTVTAPGSGYVTKGGIRKFQDALPNLCDPAVAGSCPDYTTSPDAKYIPLGVPAAVKYNGIAADEYDIAVVQYRTQFSSDLPATLVRGYVQLETPDNAAISQHFPLVQYNKDGTTTPLVDANNNPILAVTPPQWLGPTIVAQKDKPVRIRFHNLLPIGNEGDLFLPVDSTLMGSGMGPMQMADPVDNKSVLDEVRNPVCSQFPKAAGCFKDNRATLHLHGGITPWISDGTPHQWITPANETTDWPQGVSVKDVPDMTPRDVPDDGIQTFYYTNQQGARLMFYHDHAWGITRLNVYAGEAAGYLINDATEKKLVDSGTIPADQIPLVVQDRTFVPQDKQLYDVDGKGNVAGSAGYDPAANGIGSYGQDPTWDSQRWGGYGNFWYHHVYMPAQNPGDSSGMSPYGRWMYGPWFWPPASDTKYGPIDNPYYDANCDIADPTTWQYQTDPYCEPQKIPGTPNISVGMEQFNDTPIVNGVAYPTITLQPKAYRLRMLNAANDRFFNFQWYVADPSTASAALNKAGDPIGGTEVALKASELAAAQIDPAGVSPTPDTTVSLTGPDWIQIGSEGGFLPAPAVINGHQVTTWITDPTRFDFGNVDKHSLVLAPAERADVIVDFSKFAGQTLILYNDAPAAYPARVPSYDYYTGGPDLSPVGAPAVLPGFGPNTRTIMQVKIANTTADPAFNLQALNKAFTHKADGSGVFENGQHPVIVGQAAYNSAYGASFPASSNCSPAGGSTLQVCDGFVRVADSSSFAFNTLRSQKSKVTMPLQPKAIHDEMNASTFDEFGRMTANLGIEAQPPTPGLQNVTLYPFVNPATELINGTDLPKAGVVYDSTTGLPASDVKITPVRNNPDGSVTDGTQIWRITHNGVDTHPIHFHLYDVQLINRVTWDNIIIPPDANELGWKDTVRMSPLEDTIVALRPIVPDVPFEVPNSVRDLNPMMPEGSTAMFNPIDPQGNPTNPIANQLVNYGWEYVWHCHILSHEEMDMMRPVALVLPPIAASNLIFAEAGGHAQITFDDNSITETSFVLQRNDGSGWADAATLDQPLQNNTHGSRTITDPTAYDPQLVYSYRVVAKNTVGYVADPAYPSMTAQSVSAVIQNGTAPLAPSALSGVIANSVDLTWTDNATDETGFTIQRADNGGAWATIATAPANTAADPTQTGPVTYVDKTVTPGNSYAYRVRADKGAASSAWSNTFTIAIPAVPGAPTGLTATVQASTGGPQVALQFTDTATNETGFQLQRRDNGGAWVDLVALPAAAGSGTTVTYTDGAVTPGNTYDYQVRALTGTPIVSAWSNTATAIVPAVPAAPSNLAGVVQAGPSISLGWTDNATTEQGFTLQRSSNNGATWTPVANTLPANTTGYVDTPVTMGTTYLYRVRAFNISGVSAWATSAGIAVPTPPAAPTNLTGTIRRTAAGPDTVTLRWVDRANNETGFVVQRATDSGFTANVVTLATGANVTTLTDVVAHGFIYYYRVRAVNAVAVSAWSNVVNVTTVPATPTNLRATGVGRTALTLTWNDVSANETGYQVQSKRANNNNWRTITTTRANATSYRVTGLRVNTAYDFRVRGQNRVGSSPWTASLRVRTLP